jgi:hypothetical protein
VSQPTTEYLELREQNAEIFMMRKFVMKDDEVGGAYGTLGSGEKCSYLMSKRPLGTRREDRNIILKQTDEGYNCLK